MTGQDGDLTALAEDTAAMERRAQLRAALAIVARMAGVAEVPAETPDEIARRADAYRGATPIARRRLDALAAEAGAFASAGIAALIRHRDTTGRDCAPAASQLMLEMRRAIAAMDRLAPLG